MNTNGLAKCNDKLTPRERVPLMLAARARRDEKEFARLKRSAPRKCFEVSDHLDFLDGLWNLAAGHVMQQLDLTAWYWQLREQYAEHCWWQDDGDNDPLGDRLRFLQRLAAYVFLVNADAWQQFCGELAIDPEALLRGYPGYDTIKQMEDNARCFACSPEDVTAFVQQRDPAAHARTVENTVEQLREALKQWTNS